MLGQLILSAFSREIVLEDGSHGEVAEPLKLLLREYRDFQAIVFGKRVLDFGCGFGDQAAAIAQRFGCEVTGLDTNEKHIEEAKRRHGHVAQFVASLPRGHWDVVISQDAMEHFTDPEAALEAMRTACGPHGVILLTFGPPWWAPYGSHMNFFCRIPWLQLWFTERTVMAVRAKFRNDGARRYEEVESGLNKMSLAKFECLLRKSGLRVLRLDYRGVKRLDFLTRVPVLREFATTHVTAILAPQ